MCVLRVHFRVYVFCECVCAHVVCVRVCAYVCPVCAFLCVGVGVMWVSMRACSVCVCPVCAFPCVCD